MIQFIIYYLIDVDVVIPPLEGSIPQCLRVISSAGRLCVAVVTEPCKKHSVAWQSSARGAVELENRL